MLYRKNRLLGNRIVTLGLLLIFMALSFQTSTRSTHASSLDWSAVGTVPPSAESNLVFSVSALSDPGYTTTMSIMRLPKTAIELMSSQIDQGISEASMPTLAQVVSFSRECEINGLNAAPRGPWVAVELACANGHTTIINAVHGVVGEMKTIGAELGTNNVFLNWSPTGNEVVVRADVLGNPRVYLIHIIGGKIIPLNLPGHTYDVTLSPDGQRMAYSLTRGLGFGSETWVANLDGSEAQLVISDPTHIIAYARFSPDGGKIAYIRMADSNIPFTAGELWVMNADGSRQTLLSQADAGHGYAPDWSPDSKQIAFVYRENAGDVTADQVADRLVSNIYVADLGARVVSAVTKFNAALVESPAWSSDGTAVAFSVRPVGGMADVWVVSPNTPDRQAHQVTQNANARYPTWLFGAPQPALLPTPGK